MVEKQERRRVYPVRSADVLHGPVSEIAADAQALQEPKDLEIAVHKLRQPDVGIDLRSH